MSRISYEGNTLLIMSEIEDRHALYFTSTSLIPTGAERSLDDLLKYHQTKPTPYKRLK